MSRRLVFRAAAKAEFNDAAAWYEEQRVGLGADFIAEVQQALDLIANAPGRYPVAHGDVRVVLVRKFPYGVYYRVKPDRVVVIAVFHSSRNPAIWQSRK